MDALTNGVRIELRGQPRTERIRNTPAVRRNHAVCQERVDYFNDIRALEQLSEAPKLLQPLHVILRHPKKARLVLDLSRNCNDLVERERFRQQRFRDAVDASTPGCYYGKMDLADCFYSFPVHKDSQHLLAFELGGSYYRFRRLPMGLSSSP